MRTLGTVEAVKVSIIHINSIDISFPGTGQHIVSHHDAFFRIINLPHVPLLILQGSCYSHGYPPEKKNVRIFTFPAVSMIS